MNLKEAIAKFNAKQGIVKKEKKKTCKKCNSINLFRAGLCQKHYDELLFSYFPNTRQNKFK